ncbi:MAG TPA: hypothetical protein VLI90_19055, partial [Tepidisphaeraceae bacterium]|nr:hypothetical protein [Tepidisphaeraceae bacterium]
VLAALAAALVIYVYRRDGRSRAVRISLGILRGGLLLLVLLLLNRPVLTLGQSRTEPSVLAIMVDDSISMRVRDAGDEHDPQSRLQAAENLLSDHDAELLRTLSQRHALRFYRFDCDAQPISALDPSSANAQPAVEALQKLEPTGQSTQVLPSILSVMQDLQGQRVAGVVVMTDGRDTPTHAVGSALDTLKNYGVKVYPLAIGSDRQPRNIEVQGVTVEDTAFKGDIVNVKASVRASGFEANHPVQVVLKDKKTGAQLPGIDGSPAERTINLPDDKPVEVELQWKTSDVGSHDVIVEAVRQPGEVDDDDNVRTAQVAVLDAKISVLYVDGYPRWEYRYLKNEMVRDKTVDISCLLSSADPGFAQEGDKPIRRFPESIEELMDYDVVVFGDVDPRFFTDTQLQLVSEFVSRKGGGFAMIAGPRFAPQAYRNTAIEPVLPVAISRVEGTDSNATITQGFRPVLTRVGQASSIFRFFADRQQNENFLKNDIQPIFWYCRGVTVKPGVGEVYAEHPTDVAPDGRKAPILVLGRFGAGRTLFSSIDDSWRWRFYTGESVFDTYWVQQLRYLARSRKIGQRKVTLTAGRPVYELGGQVRLTLRILDPVLLQQLPEQIRVEVRDANGQPVRFENLMRQEGQSDLYTGSFTADRVGKFTVQLPPIAGGVDMMEVPLEISLPRLELIDPQVDRTQLSRLASETLGKAIDLSNAKTELPQIPSAAKVIPVVSGQPLWDAPLTMGLFVLLIATEWVLRKVYGMV